MRSWYKEHRGPILFTVFLVVIFGGLAVIVTFAIINDSASEQRCHDAGGHWIQRKAGAECWVGHKIKV
jgi:hypothetical protein